MKKYTLTAIVLLILAAAIEYYYRSLRTPLYQIVTLSGFDNFGNYTQTYPNLVQPGKTDSITALPVCNNDILIVFDKDLDFQCLYRYAANDGKSLKFSRDRFLIKLNGQLVSLLLQDNDDTYNWLTQANDSDIDHLNSIMVGDTLSEKYYPLIKKIASQNRDIGLVVMGNGVKVNKLLANIHPTWIYSEISLDSLDKQQILRLNHLVFLGAPELNADSAFFVQLVKLPSLRHLLLFDLDLNSPWINKVENNQIESLNLFEPEEINLAFIKNFHALKQLSLVQYDSKLNMGFLQDLSNLRVLNLIGDSISNLNLLNQMNALVWATIPSSVHQPEFETFVNQHPGLDVLHINGDDQLLDLSPLKDLHNLSCLTIFGDTANIKSIDELKDLDYLSLPDKVYNDSLNFVTLKTKLPNTIIVPNTGFCLGSGWLLLFIPIMLMMYVTIDFIRKRKSGVVKHV